MSIFRSAVSEPLQIVKNVLQGGTLVLIGGDKRHEHMSRLAQAFDLSEVVWIETRESDPSPRRFSAILARGEVLLVVSLQGLMRHQHARDIRELCTKHELPHLPYWRSPHPTGLAESVVRCHLLRAIAERRQRAA